MIKRIQAVKCSRCGHIDELPEMVDEPNIRQPKRKKVTRRTGYERAVPGGVPDGYVTQTEAGRILGEPYESARQMIKDYGLNTQKLGRRRLVVESEVLELAQLCRTRDIE